jgi:hypothetical protein
MVKGPDAGKDVKARGRTCFLGCGEKSFCGVSKEGKRGSRGRLKLGIANNHVARGRGSYV